MICSSFKCCGATILGQRCTGIRFMVYSKTLFVTFLKNFRNDAISLKISGLHKNLYQKKNQTIMANFKRKPNPLDYMCKDIPCSFKSKIPDCNHPGLQSLL